MPLINIKMNKRESEDQKTRIAALRDFSAALRELKYASPKKRNQVLAKYIDSERIGKKDF